MFYLIAVLIMISGIGIGWLVIKALEPDSGSTYGGFPVNRAGNGGGSIYR
jgi:hypothetical protein